eukprot:7159054-Prymnesium_polylepis.1
MDVSCALARRPRGGERGAGGSRLDTFARVCTPAHVDGAAPLRSVHKSARRVPPTRARPDQIAYAYVVVRGACASCVLSSS